MAETIPQEEREKVEALIDQYTGLVFSDDKIGQIRVKPIHLDYNPEFTPNQPPFHNIPIHYQPEVSNLLQFLREQGVITDVDPSETQECVMNTVITDKKSGDIRMNVDSTPWNPGMKRTKFHVQTPQEIRHELKEAKVFTDGVGIPPTPHRRELEGEVSLSNSRRATSDGEIVLRSDSIKRNLPQRNSEDTSRATRSPEHLRQHPHLGEVPS